MKGGGGVRRERRSARACACTCTCTHTRHTYIHTQRASIMHDTHTHTLKSTSYVPSRYTNLCCMFIVCSLRVHYVYACAHACARLCTP
jgi:hypothetical protein